MNVTWICCLTKQVTASGTCCVFISVIITKKKLFGVNGAEKPADQI